MGHVICFLNVFMETLGRYIGGQRLRIKKYQREERKSISIKVKKAEREPGPGDRIMKT